MTDGYYPGVFERMRAIFFDTLIIIIFMFIATWLFSHFENVPDHWRIAAFVFIFILYDPLFTSLFGGTIGHMIVGIRVKRESDPSKNILFPLAIIRYVVKIVLGSISLLTLASSPKRKAIHDMIVGSVVVYNK